MSKKQDHARRKYRDETSALTLHIGIHEGILNLEGSVHVEAIMLNAPLDERLSKREGDDEKGTACEETVKESRYSSRNLVSKVDDEVAGLGIVGKLLLVVLDIDLVNEELGTGIDGLLDERAIVHHVDHGEGAVRDSNVLGDERDGRLRDGTATNHKANKYAIRIFEEDDIIIGVDIEGGRYSHGR